MGSITYGFNNHLLDGKINNKLKSEEIYVLCYYNST